MTLRDHPKDMHIMTRTEKQHQTVFKLLKSIEEYMNTIFLVSDEDLRTLLNLNLDHFEATFKPEFLQNGSDFWVSLRTVCPGISKIKHYFSYLILLHFTYG